MKIISWSPKYTSQRILLRLSWEYPGVSMLFENCICISTGTSSMDGFSLFSRVYDGYKNRCTQRLRHRRRNASCLLEEPSHVAGRCWLRNMKGLRATLWRELWRGRWYVYVCILYVNICACMLMNEHSFRGSALQPCSYVPSFLASWAFVDGLCCFCY